MGQSIYGTAMACTPPNCAVSTKGCAQLEPKWGLYGLGRCPGRNVRRGAALARPTEGLGDVPHDDASGDFGTGRPAPSGTKCQPPLVRDFVGFKDLWRSQGFVATDG